MADCRGIKRKALSIADKLDILSDEEEVNDTTPILPVTNALDRVNEV